MRDRRALKSAAIALFFAIQLAMAAPSYFNDLSQERGRFSWNMFAYRYECSARYWLVDANGKRKRIKHNEELNYPRRWYAFTNSIDLPRFHAHLCQVNATPSGPPRIEAQVGCQLDHRPRIEFVPSGTDICTAPNHGVPPR